MKQTLRTLLVYYEREYAKPLLLTVAILGVLASETVMGGLGLKAIIGNWGFVTSFAIATLQVLSSHSWGHRSAHNAMRQVRVGKTGKETKASEPRQPPRLPRAISFVAGAVSVAFGGLGLVPGMIEFTGNVVAGWVLGGFFSLASPAAAIGLALLMGNEAQVWRKQSEWEAAEAEKAERGAQRRAVRAREKAEERKRAQERAERERARAEQEHARAEAKQRRASMSTDERRRALLEEWRADRHASTSALARKYSVHPSTIRRDLDALEAEGLAWREDEDTVGVSG